MKFGISLFLWLEKQTITQKFSFKIKKKKKNSCLNSTYFLYSLSYCIKVWGSNLSPNRKYHSIISKRMKIIQEFIYCHRILQFFVDSGEKSFVVRNEISVFQLNCANVFYSQDFKKYMKHWIKLNLLKYNISHTQNSRTVHQTSRCLFLFKFPSSNTMFNLNKSKISLQSEKKYYDKIQYANVEM